VWVAIRQSIQQLAMRASESNQPKANTLGVYFATPQLCVSEGLSLVLETTNFVLPQDEDVK